MSSERVKIFYITVSSLQTGGFLPPRSSMSDSSQILSWALLLSSVLCRKKPNKLQESSQIRQDLFPPPYGLFRVSPLKSFHPLHFLILTESLSFTSLRKTRLRSSPASWAIRATIWPDVPISIRM